MRDRLNSAQRLALVAITRCFRTTSTIALQVLAGCLPLDLQVELEFNLTQLRRFQRAATLGNTKIVPSEVHFPLSKYAPPREGTSSGLGFWHPILCRHRGVH